MRRTTGWVVTGDSHCGVVPFILLFLLHIQGSSVVLRSVFFQSLILYEKLFSPEKLTYLRLPFCLSHESEFVLTLQARIRRLLKWNHLDLTKGTIKWCQVLGSRWVYKNKLNKDFTYWSSGITGCLDGGAPCCHQ